METKAKDASMDRLRRKLRFDHMLPVAPIDGAGGLALFLLNSVHLQMIHSSKNIIDARILPSSHSEWWRIYCVYGNPNGGFNSGGY